MKIIKTAISIFAIRFTCQAAGTTCQIRAYKGNRFLLQTCRCCYLRRPNGLWANRDFFGIYSALRLMSHTAIIWLAKASAALLKSQFSKFIWRKIEKGGTICSVVLCNYRMSIWSELLSALHLWSVGHFFLKYHARVPILVNIVPIKSKVVNDGFQYNQMLSQKELLCSDI